MLHLQATGMKHQHGLYDPAGMFFLRVIHAKIGIWGGGGGGILGRECSCVWVHWGGVGLREGVTQFLLDEAVVHICTNQWRDDVQVSN